jgi:hypothetical protein
LEKEIMIFTDVPYGRTIITMASGKRQAASGKRQAASGLLV